MASRSSLDDRKLRPIQTAVFRPSTAPHSGTPTTGSHPQTGSTIQTDSTPEQDSAVPEAPPGHQRFVLTDPVAFRYLEADPSTTALARRQELQGYESHVIEQWTTSRSHPTFTITTYTGDPNHIIFVSVLSVPTDETIWSPRLRVYFKALNQYHAKRRETPLGTLMVTNLSGFPSSLAVIPVPDGDLRKHRFDFYVNENLKRLGCSGRVGLTLTPPVGATVAKFHQLYRTSDKNDVYRSVIELVKLCQSALMLFDKLEIDYADGLLCDVTERAINDWWMDTGSSYYNLEPHDGILGPTTVAGLLGLLMGTRNRLHAVSAPVTKDAFDVESMKRGISAFQKQQRITRTRRLDRQTLDRLHRATQKAANHDGWTMPKAVKSTVAELSGKGGEMVMDVVGRRDKAGIAEIETCDIDRFVQLLYGERCKWLWWGKPLKKGRRDPLNVEKGWDEPAGGEGKSLQFREGEYGGFTWTTRKSVGDVLQTVGKREKEREQYNDTASPAAQQSADEEDEEREGIRGVLKRTSGFKEATSGLGRLKGAVGLGGGHRQTSSKDETPTPQSPISPKTPPDEYPSKEWRRRPMIQRTQSSPATGPNSPNSPNKEHRPNGAWAGQKKLTYNDIIQEQAAPAYAASYRESATRVSEDGGPPPSFVSTDGKAVTDESGRPRAGSDEASEKPSDQTDGTDGPRPIEPSVAGSIYDDVDENSVLPETEQDAGRLLRRTMSISQFVGMNTQSRYSDAYPRHLSFSLAEDSVLTWTQIVEHESDRDAYYNDARGQMADESFFAEEAKGLRAAIGTLSGETASWTRTQLHTLDSLLTGLDEDQEALHSMYYPRQDALHGLQTASESLLRSEKERLEEGGKEIETLAARLDYEINGLKGRVEEVEVGVGEFERGVKRVEDRVLELKKEGEKDERGWGCVVL